MLFAFSDMKMGCLTGSAPAQSPSQGEMLLLHHRHHEKVAPAVGNAPTCNCLTGSPPTCGARWNGKWSGRQVTLLFDLAPKASASLLGYVPNGKWSRTGGSHSADLVPETSVVAS